MLKHLDYILQIHRISFITLLLGNTFFTYAFFYACIKTTNLKKIKRNPEPISLPRENKIDITPNVTHLIPRATQRPYGHLNSHLMPGPSLSTKRTKPG